MGDWDHKIFQFQKKFLTRFSKGKIRLLKWRAGGRAAAKMVPLITDNSAQLFAHLFSL